MLNPIVTSLLFFLFLSSSFHVTLGAGDDLKGKDKSNPYTPKAYLIRYWNNQIKNSLPNSAFFLSKASPLNAVDAASFAKLASQNTLSSAFPSFCSSSKLFCFPDSPSLILLENDKAAAAKANANSNFAAYGDKNFTNYGEGKNGGANTFKSYSENESSPPTSFRQYSSDSTDQKDKFTAYATSANVADQNFNSYGDSSTGGSGDFKKYMTDANLMNVNFNKYSGSSDGRSQSFSSYVNGTNAGVEWFTSYGKKGNRDPNEFLSYANEANWVQSKFKGYSEGAKAANDTFISYNVLNEFKSYVEKGIDRGVDSFKTYKGYNTFKAYAKSTNSSEVNFANYNLVGSASDLNKFTGYNRAGFKFYRPNEPDFKEYAKKGSTFALYNSAASESAVKASGGLVNKLVEPGKFFRESMLKEGSVMPMPDIRDKMPQRSFLPRSIVSKLPFSSSKLSDMKEIFHAGDDSEMERIMKDSLNDCERAPSRGETKQCVGSGEDMIDFATSVLGHDVTLRTTENVKGSKQNIMIGSVKGINGGKVTKSVSCHQSLYPYLLYYCHSVPKVRVYEADILDAKTKAKINNGVAICHLDTSAWGPTHGAFVALGSSPGKIEVCHWIFENDLTWTVADH